VGQKKRLTGVGSSTSLKKGKTANEVQGNNI